MNMFWINLVCVLICGLSLGGATNLVVNSTINTYKMHEKCGQTINMKWKSIYTAQIAFDFKMDDNNFRPAVAKHGMKAGNQYSSPVMCELVIESWNFLDRLMVQFSDLHLQSGCDNGFIEVLDGPSSGSPPVKGLPSSPICQHHIGPVLSVPYTTSDKHLTLRVHGNQQQTISFTATVVAFHEGDCRSYEHTCASGRCIMDDLVCNGHNPCGDNSDCLTRHDTPREVNTEESTVLVIALAAISTAIGVLLIGSTIFCVAYRRRRKRMRQQQNLSSFDPPRSHTRANTSVSFQVERSISQIEAERRLAPPSYSTLPVSQEAEESEDSEHECEEPSDSANNEENNRGPCFDLDNNNPPSYACVMLYKDEFRLSSNDIDRTEHTGPIDS